MEAQDKKQAPGKLLSGLQRFSYGIDGLLLLLALWIVHPMWFNMRIVSGGADLFCLFLPYHYLNREAWLAGNLPLWNPFSFMGVPLAATMQSGSWYPFTLITVWCSDVVTGVKIFRLFHVWLFGFFCYLWLRRHHAHSRWGALAAGVVAIGSTYVSGHHNHINQLASLAWMPMVVWGFQATVDRALKSGKIFSRAGCFFSLSLALQLLAGHPQNVFYTLLICGGYFAYWLIKYLKLLRAAARLRVAFAVPVLGVILGVLLASIQLLPTQELSSRSYRVFDDFNYSAFGSMQPENLARRILLHPFGKDIFPNQEYEMPPDEEGMYVGLLPLLLLVCGIFFNRFWRWQNLMLVGCMALVAVLALGHFTPLYKIYYILFQPVVRHFRVPPRILCVALFLLVYLVSNAIHSLPKTFKDHFEALLIFVALLFVLELAWFYNGRDFLHARQLNANASLSEEMRVTANPWLHSLRSLSYEKHRSSRYGSDSFEGFLKNNNDERMSLSRVGKSLGDRHRLFRLMPSDSDFYLLAGSSRSWLAGIQEFESHYFDFHERRQSWIMEPNPTLFAFYHKHRLAPNVNLFSGVPIVQGYEEGISPPARHFEFMNYFTKNLRSANPDQTLLRLMGVGTVLFQGQVQQPDQYQEVLSVPQNHLGYGTALGYAASLKKPAAIAQWLQELDPRIQMPFLDGPLFWKGQERPLLVFDKQGLSPPSKLLNSRPGEFRKQVTKDGFPWGLPPEQFKIRGETVLGNNNLATSTPIQIERLSNQRILLSWDKPLERSQWLWLAQGTFPGWKARAKFPGLWYKTDLRPVNAIGNLVACPAETTAVEIYYDPDSARVGLFISLLSFCFWIAILIRTIARSILALPGGRGSRRAVGLILPSWFGRSLTLPATILVKAKLFLVNGIEQFNL